MLDLDDLKMRAAPRVLVKHAAEIAIPFVAYFAAGKLGQATTNIRSGNLGPVWPAFGIALAAVLLCGSRVWIGIAAAAFVVALSSPVPAIVAAGQAASATMAALIGAFVLVRIAKFHSSMSRLHDALTLIVLGAFGSSLLSATMGISVLYAAHEQAYSGIFSAWLIYWLGDSTGILLVTPLVLTGRNLLKVPRGRILEFAALLVLLTTACFIIFSDLLLGPVKLHFLAFAVFPFVIWAATRFGSSGAALSIFLIAAIATVETAVGSGPFAQNTPFINAVLLDVFFAVLSISGMTLAAAIAEREQAETDRLALVREQAGTEARLRLAAIVESSDDAIIGKDMDGIITDWNKAAEHLYGYSAIEAIGKPISLLVPSGRSSEPAEIMEALRQGISVRNFETVRQKKDGTSVEVSLTVSPIRDAKGQTVGGSVIYHDITERKLAQEALANTNHRLIGAQEQERTRIARELHDDIGQRLALLSIELDQFQRASTGLSAEARSRLGKFHKQAVDLVTDTQSLSHELHSSKLEYLGIVAAARGFCREFGEQQKLEIDFQTHDLPNPVPSDPSLCLFRVLQEALHNSAKHSGAQHVEVQLWGTSGEIHLSVRDTGSGFDRERAKESQGLGLVSMEERLKMLKGTLTIESQPKCGTTIYARLPLSIGIDSMRAAG